MTHAPRRPSPATLALLALVAGALLGALGHGDALPAVPRLEPVATLVADTWLAALLAVVLPFVVVQVAAAAGGTETGADGRTGRRLLLLCVAILAGAGMLAALVARPLVARLPLDAAALAAAGAAVHVPDAAREAAGRGITASLPDFLRALVPSNVVGAAARGEILPLLVAGLLFGLALRRVDAARRAVVTGLLDALLATLHVLLDWIMRLVPAAVFAFAFRAALGAGGALAGALAGYLVVVCGVLALATLLCYPLAVLAGRVPFRRFARAVAQAQLVALATRSSIAALPALLAGARETLRLPPVAGSVVLPLCTALFKPSATVAKAVGVVFLARAFDVPLPLPALAAFVGIVTLLSVTTVGVPLGGATFVTLPAYLAMGIPLEGVVLLAAVEPVPDVVKTVLNVTANLAVATVVTREGGSGRLVPEHGAAASSAAMMTDA